VKSDIGGQFQGAAKESSNMKIIALTTAFTLMATLTASGDDVPFAAPSFPRPGQPDTSNVVTLGDIMAETQLRHIKLWFAGKSGIGTWPIMKSIELAKASGEPPCCI
jgi:hypothetical protein